MRAVVVVATTFRDEPYRVPAGTLFDARRQARGMLRRHGDVLLSVTIERSDGKRERVKA